MRKFIAELFEYENTFVFFFIVGFVTVVGSAVWAALWVAGWLIAHVRIVIV